MTQKGVVIEENKVLRKPLDTVNIELNYIGVERRTVLLFEDIFMSNNIELRVRGVKPLWKVPPRYEVDAPYPRCETLYTAKPIFQILPIAKTNLGTVAIPIGVTSRLDKLLAPIGVVAVNPEDNKIYLKLRVRIHNQMLFSCLLIETTLLYEPLGNLHRIQCCSLLNLVSYAPECKTIWVA